ncbi:NUDIX hydrolase [Actinoplanes sp. NPDC051633]|uniref:NUDIX hydrolase n=1 Tax=Actinoplanes sp. NPDC051633 TaxID=3155670 RepID=UPI003435C597
MRWNNLAEHTVYENQWLTVNLADVELPDGRHLAHFLIRQRPVALCAVVNSENEVLLLWRHRFITDTWGWELPAGVVEDDETIEQAAARETIEETGWRPGALEHLVTVEPTNGLSDVQHHIFWARGAEYVGEPADDFESTKREWIPLAQVPHLVSTGGIRAANAAAALLLLHDRLTRH